MGTEELKSLLAEVTQGDWLVSHYDAEKDAVVIVSHKGEYVASIVCNGGLKKPPVVANARLIAMAPALARRVIAAGKLAEVLERIAKCRNVDAFNREGSSYEASLAKAALAEWEAAQ